MKKAAMIFPGVVLTVLLLLSSGCSDRLSRAYYAHHPMSTAELARVWGDPVKVIPLSGGIEKRVYQIQNPYTDLKYRYFLVQGDMVLASGISDTFAADAKNAPSGEVSGFVPSDLSKAFYSQNRTTVAELDKVWGAPVQVKALGDGQFMRTYAIPNPYTDFKYRRYIVKDGIVVASRISPAQDLKVEPHPSAFKGIEINEISHAYYKAHPMRLAEVETVWGAPVKVQRTSSGLEKRYYKIKVPSDAGFEFRFFVVQNKMVVSSGICDTVAVNAN